MRVSLLIGTAIALGSLVCVSRVEALEDFTSLFEMSHENARLSQEAQEAKAILKAAVKASGRLRTAVRGGEDPDVPNDGSALHRAALAGDANAVQKLIADGADVNARMQNQRTPLHLAAMGGHTAVATTLLDNGAEVNALDKDGWSALFHAAKGGHAEVAATVMDRGCRISYSDKNGVTPLHLAAQLGSVATVEALLEHEAYVHGGCAPDGNTPLHLAIVGGHFKVTQMLVDAGSNPNTPNARGLFFPLHLAVRGGFLEIARFLLEKPQYAYPNSVDNEGNTPLHLAAQQGDLPLVKLLVEIHADRDKWTPKANVNIRNKEDKTALDLARDSQRHEVVEYLTKRGAK